MEGGCCHYSSFLFLSECRLLLVWTTVQLNLTLSPPYSEDWAHILLSHSLIWTLLMTGLSRWLPMDLMQSGALDMLAFLWIYVERACGG